MTEIFWIALSGLIVFAAGLPIVTWFHKAKQEMKEAEKHDDAE